MLNNKRYKLPLIILFSLIQAALFFLVQITHGKVNIFVSYLVVLLCCLFASLYFEKTKKYQSRYDLLIKKYLAIQDPPSDQEKD